MGDIFLAFDHLRAGRGRFRGIKASVRTGNDYIRQTLRKGPELEHPVTRKKVS